MIAVNQRLTNKKWLAIIQNDATYDGQFYYAIKTTGIFCRPSCKSRVPKRENVLIFQNSEQALSANFRPCKRCKPTGERLPDHEWVVLITHYIDNHYNETLTLQTLADMCHGSPFHLHRTFKRVKEMTPVQYIQHKRISKAKEKLANTELGIADIAVQVGIANVSYFITQFKKVTGCTPKEYRLINKKESVLEGVLLNENKK